MTVSFYRKYLYIISGLAGLLYGIDNGVIAAALPYINNSGNYTTEQLGLIVGMVLWGTVITSLFAGQLSEWFGRKKIIIAAALLFIISIPTCCASGYFAGGNFELLATGRILQGASGGLIAVVVPMYLAECLDKKSRGSGTAMFQLILTLGMVFAALVGLIVTSLVGPAYTPEAGTKVDIETLDLWTAAWQIIFGVSIIPAVILFFGAFFLKESPRWLYNKGKKDLAIKSLAANNGMDKAKKIMADMIEKDKIDDAEKKKNKSLAARESLLKRKYVLPFLLTCLVMILTQCTGINTILNYSVTIFTETGLHGEAANWGDFGIKFVNFFVTIFAVALVDKRGRKFLLKIGTALIVVGEVGVAIMLALMDNYIIAATTTSGLITSICFYIFAAGFAFGPGVCVWLALTELMPTRIRANGMAIAMIVNQGVSASLASIFPTWVEATSMATVFAFFALCSVGFFLVATFVLPETKGKTLEEISKIFEKNKNK